MKKRELDRKLDECRINRLENEIIGLRIEVEYKQCLLEITKKELS